MGTFFWQPDDKHGLIAAAPLSPSPRSLSMSFSVNPCLSLCSRFTTDPSRVLSYLSLVPRTSSPFLPSFSPISLSSLVAFAAAETIAAVAGGLAVGAKRPGIYSTARRARHHQFTALCLLGCLLACVSVCLSVDSERASELLTPLLSLARNSH